MNDYTTFPLACQSRTGLQKVTQASAPNKAVEKRGTEPSSPHSGTSQREASRCPEPLSKQLDDSPKSERKLGKGDSSPACPHPAAAAQQHFQLEFAKAIPPTLDLGCHATSPCSELAVLSGISLDPFTHMHTKSYYFSFLFFFFFPKNPVASSVGQKPKKPATQPHDFMDSKKAPVPSSCRNSPIMVYWVTPSQQPRSIPAFEGGFP